jgi:hypothetical protein
MFLYSRALLRLPGGSLGLRCWLGVLAMNKFDTPVNNMSILE